jgi:hypothetical protein
MYQSHKKVHASKIISIEKNPEGGAFLILETEGFPPLPVNEEWMKRHQPQALGYLVAYQPDGYLSWSPAQQFEDGYTRLP